MKIAIIGAGFAGLGAAYFLTEHPGVSVTIFDAVGVGGGASGAASGLLHPYPGLAARRSHRAEEALKLSKELIRIAEANTPQLVASHGGIVRAAIDRDQRDRLLSHAEEYPDIEHLGGDRFFIHSGITVHSRNYLEGLMNALKKRGVSLICHQVRALDELSSFDQVVIAAGFGIRAFKECQHLPIKFLKGQALTLKGPAPFEQSFISKGYLATLKERSAYEVGSTYEREFSDALPNLEIAKELLKERLGKDPLILDCRAGVRVMRVGHYLPILDRVKENAFVFTALGSRGLLYHALYGRTLAHQMVQSKSRKE